MTPLLPVAEAQARLLAQATPVPEEVAPLDLAAGRWLARDVVALRDQPVADLSAMDGYALRHAELPGPWRLVGESAAGRPHDAAIGAGEAVRIFTGAQLPAGADTILIQEDARTEGAMLHLAGDPPPREGYSVRRRGMDFSCGQTVLSAGERLTPARLALAAVAGFGALPVRRKVRVALYATGDELVAPGSEDLAALPESNTAMLRAMLADLPVEIVATAIVPDRMDALVAAFAVPADLIVTTGGASVGDHDLVRPALEAAGGIIDFWRIALRPGKPLLAGRRGNTLVVGLPGNPVSSFVTGQLFVRPLVAVLAGSPDPLPRTRTATLGEDLPANDRRSDYLRAWHVDGRVVSASVQDSAMLGALARADCLILRPPFAPAAKIGDQVEILPLA